MKIKKLFGTLAIVALAATMLIGGTLAYLTDRDGSTNVFTVGEVSIALSEDFAQGAQLLPGVKIEKEARIENTGKNDAYVWMSVAIPAAMDNDDASKNIIHMNVPGAYWYGYHDEQKYWEGAGLSGPVDESKTWKVDAEVEKDVEIDGVKYNVYTHLYNGPIKPDEATNPALSQVYMDTHIDVDPEGNMFWVDGGVTTDLNWNVNDESTPKLYISAYAIQAEGFATVEEAYAAYGAQWGENGLPEFEAPAVVADSAALRAALAEGGDILLSGDVELETYISADTSINLLGNTILPTSTQEVKNGADLSLENGTWKKTGTYGHLDVRPTADTESIITITNVDFVNETAGSHFGSSSNFTDSVLELYGLDDSASAKIVFKDCSFTNACVLVEGSSSGPTNFDLSFENCTFNNLGNSSAIKVANYCVGTLSVTNCTFNLKVTSNVKAIEITNNTTTSVELTATGNTLNGTAALVDQDGVQKVFSTQSAVLIGAYSNTIVNASDNTENWN